MFINQLNAGAVTMPFIALADQASIVMDCSQGNAFAVTLGASRTLAAPINPVNDGQWIVLQVTQGGVGSFTLTMNGIFIFGSTITSITLSTAVGAVDMIGFLYRKTPNVWRVMSLAQGFAS